MEHRAASGGREGKTPRWLIPLPKNINIPFGNLKVFQFETVMEEELVEEVAMLRSVSENILFLLSLRMRESVCMFEGHCYSRSSFIVPPLCLMGHNATPFARLPILGAVFRLVMLVFQMQQLKKCYALHLT